VEVVRLKVTPVTGIGLTRIIALAVWLPSTVVTVIVAVPGLIPVTTPLFTVATFAFVVDHTTLRLVALAGVILAISDSVSSTYFLFL